MDKKITPPLTIGIIIALIIIVLSIIEYITNLDQQKWVFWVNILIVMSGVIYACTNYGKQSEGNVTFGNTFAFGFKTSAIVTCLIIAFGIIFLLIFPEIKEKAIETARQQMEKNNQVTQEQIDAGLGFMKKGFMILMILGDILFLIAGTIASLIGAAVTKKNPSSPFQNQA